MKIALVIPLLILSITLLSAENKFRLHNLFSDHMVLQKDSIVPVYGYCEPYADVTVEFDGKSKSTRASKQGKWLVKLPAMTVNSEGRSLKVTRKLNGVKREITINNVLVGDVWICGGQSNMDYAFKQYPILRDKVNDIKNPQIRIMSIKHNTSSKPKEEPRAVIPWDIPNPKSLSEFSATAYYFAEKLQSELQIPIGLIESAWGGTRVESWLPTPSGSKKDTLMKGSEKRHRPTYLYNAMIHPLRLSAIKGFIWYQGESNADSPVEYAGLFKDLITSWRKVFNQGDLPFYYVQLAPFKPLAWNKKGHAWAWLRKSQEAALSLANTGMAVITDSGEYDDIHPPAKQTTGERLALHALKAEDREVVADGPVFNDMIIKDNYCILNFSETADGLESRNVAMNKDKNFEIGKDPNAYKIPRKTLAGFQICGPDKKFLNAKAFISSKTQVKVSHPDIPKPVAVRYGWNNFPLCNLYNKSGLPARPFRTDDYSPPEFTGAIIGQDFSDKVIEGKLRMKFPKPEDTKGAESVLSRTEIDGRDGISVKGGSSAYRMLYAKCPGKDYRDGKQKKLELTLVYFDSGQDLIMLEYDSMDPKVKVTNATGAWKHGELVRLTNTDKWKYATLELDDAYFNNRCNGYDLRFVNRFEDWIVGGIYVRPLTDAPQEN